MRRLKLFLGEERLCAIVHTDTEFSMQTLQTLSVYHMLFTRTDRIYNIRDGAIEVKIHRTGRDLEEKTPEE